MASKRKYVNRGRDVVKVGNVEIKPGATVALDESLWESADETPKLYQDFSETVEQIVELVK